MSIDLNFNKAISLNDIETRTTLKIVVKNNSNFLEDVDGNTVFAKGDDLIYGITIYGPRKIKKILDELISVFDLKFLDDAGEDELRLLAEIIYDKTMEKYGYKIKPYIENITNDEESSDLPF